MSRVLNRLLNDARGVASLEFAIIVPMMFMVLIGIYQICELVRVNMKLSSVAVSVADLVAQQAGGVSGGTSGSLGNFCAAARLMMTPFPTGSSSQAFSLAIVSVTNYSPGNITVDWEVDSACTIHATAIGAAATTLATAPVNLLPTTGPSGTSGVAGSTVIIVQAHYSYASLIQYLAPAIATMTKTGFSHPRTNGVVTCTASCS